MAEGENRDQEEGRKHRNFSKQSMARIRSLGLHKASTTKKEERGLVTSVIKAGDNDRTGVMVERGTKQHRELRARVCRGAAVM